ncbi:MAG: hypothetical protein MZU97_26510 [Bacillus subtilis]|nr:hypothetical protein [Bacillus subtilis]
MEEDAVANAFGFRSRNTGRSTRCSSRSSLFFYLFRYRPIGGILVAFKNYENYAITIGESDFYGFYAFRYIMFGPQADPLLASLPQHLHALAPTGCSSASRFRSSSRCSSARSRTKPTAAITQIISYLPKFISTVVITSIIALMLSAGNISQSPGHPERTVRRGLGWVAAGNTDAHPSPNTSARSTSSPNIWETAGYGSIVYFAAIMAISADAVTRRRESTAPANSPRSATSRCPGWPRRSRSC